MSSHSFQILTRYVVFIYFNINFAPDDRHHSVLPRSRCSRTSSVGKEYLERLRYAIPSYICESTMSLYRGLKKRYLKPLVKFNTIMTTFSRNIWHLYKFITEHWWMNLTVLGVDWNDYIRLFHLFLFLIIFCWFD